MQEVDTKLDARNQCKKPMQETNARNQCKKPMQQTNARAQSKKTKQEELPQKKLYNQKPMMVMIQLGQRKE